jgi:hypothetical protein
MVQGALTRWLSEFIDVEAVNVESREEKLLVEVTYTLRSTGERSIESFSRSVP